MKIGLIFDLDQTLIDSTSAQALRDKLNWPKVYDCIPGFASYEGIDDAMDYIKKNDIPYIIVTSSPKTYCIKVCTHWSFNHPNCVTYYDVAKGEKKPHPRPILLAVEKLGIDKENILSFGDRDIDIVASNSAGVNSVACLWGANDRDSLLKSNPRYILKKPLEIINLLQSFMNK